MAKSNPGEMPTRKILAAATGERPTAAAVSRKVVVRDERSPKPWHLRVTSEVTRDVGRPIKGLLNKAGSAERYDRAFRRVEEHRNRILAASQPEDLAEPVAASVGADELEDEDTASLPPVELNEPGHVLDTGERDTELIQASDVGTLDSVLGRTLPCPYCGLACKVSLSGLAGVHVGHDEPHCSNFGALPADQFLALALQHAELPPTDDEPKE